MVLEEDGPIRAARGGGGGGREISEELTTRPKKDDRPGIDQIQYTRFQMTSSEVVHGGLGSEIGHRRRGWVPRTQARADGCGRHLDRGERLNAP